MRATLEQVCNRDSSNLMQKEVAKMTGDYPIFGASGQIGTADFYHQAAPYVAVVKDGAGIGRTMLLPGFSSVIGTLQYLLPKENVLPGYLYYVVHHMKLAKYFSGATIPHIYFRDYKNEEFNLASLDKQREIVSTLNKIQSVIKHRRAQLAKLDELVKCRFVELFGDPVLNEKAWPCENFSKYIEFITSGSRGWAKYYSDKGSYFITIKNVKKCNITTENVQYVNPPNNAEATRTKVEEGDLLISITADLGRTGVVTKEIAQYGAYINQHLTCVRIRKGCLHPVYVAHFLETDAGKMQFLSKNQNAVKAGLNFDAIKSIQLLIPPISEQKHFVSFLARIDKLRVIGKRSIIYETGWQS